eukprot:m.185571 g.185571  ORF g.185571 m.185571 type:complete len:86 (+) comp15577_c0_seq1:2259-2516(+)
MIHVSQKFLLSQELILSSIDDGMNKFATSPESMRRTASNMPKLERGVWDVASGEGNVTPSPARTLYFPSKTFTASCREPSSKLLR